MKDDTPLDNEEESRGSDLKYNEERRVSLGISEKINFLGFALIFAGMGFPLILETDIGLSVGLTIMVIGILLIFVRLIHSSYLDANEARYGEGLGIFSIILGGFALLFSSFLILILTPAALRLFEFEWGAAVFFAVYIPLGGLLSIGVLGILAYFNYREYTKKTLLVTSSKEPLDEISYSTPRFPNERLLFYEEGFSHDPGVFSYPKEPFYFYDAITRAQYRYVLGDLDFVWVDISREGVRKRIVLMFPGEKLSHLQSVMEEHGISLVEDKAAASSSESR